MQDAMGA